MPRLPKYQSRLNRSIIASVLFSLVEDLPSAIVLSFRKIVGRLPTGSTRLKLWVRVSDRHY
ncbi:hypothetical protein, partial [Chamaesiphon sp. VAR_48_metabat_403]|uniref:hypothetical protein n=1 Tax=Chamaesiphon sp. VAR_48_metabat_403 TaxID=2964700 RepID=UPI00286DBD69